MENGEKGITFVNIPIEVFSSKKLTLAEKHLYGYLSIFKKQCCFLSNEALAAATGLSEPTISRALKSLQKMNYVFIEFINGNSASRRIYVIFDNPAKINYLVKKGLFNRGEPNQNDEGNQNDEAEREGNQNDEEGNQNDEATHPCLPNQNDYHKLKNIIKRKGVGGLAGSGPAASSHPIRENFETTKQYIVACREYNKVGANIS